MKAPDILTKAAQHMSDRAAVRDQPAGERSMVRTVNAFNALTGHQVSERDGWLFMAVLKAARACTTPVGTPDDYEDGAAYFALAGECAAAPGGAVVRDCKVVEAPAVANWSVAMGPVVAIRPGCNLAVPTWANWIAQDAGGAWYAYTEKPTIPRSDTTVWFAGDGTCERIFDEEPNPLWLDTLQQVHRTTAAAQPAIGAPTWARWVAQDANGDWYAYTEKPTTMSAKSVGWAGGCCEVEKIGSGEPNPNWRDTLQQVGP